MIKRIIVKSQSLLGSTVKVLVAIVFIILLISFVRGALRLQNTSSRIDEAKLRLEEAKRDREELLALTEEVNSDFYVERQIRDNLGLAREDEIVVVLPDDEVLRRLSPRLREKEEVVEVIPNWKKWYLHFFES